MQNQPDNQPAGDESGGGKNTFFVAADMLPEGMAADLKAGQVIEFRVVNPPDQEGEVEVEYCAGEGSEEDQGEAGEGEQNEGGDWEAQARQALSPQAPENEA